MKKSITLAAVLLAAHFLPLNAAYANGYGCDSQKAVAFPFFEPNVAGRGKLCVFSNSLLGQVRLTNLIPGNAYTVWWVYLDAPTLCTGDSSATGGASLTGGASGCEFADFEGDKPLGIFGRMASGIAPRSGRLNLRGRFGGMQPSNGSEIWFWVFTHGAADLSDGAALARQLLTPEDPNAGAPHLGNNLDGQKGFPAATSVFRIE